MVQLDSIGAVGTTMGLRFNKSFKVAPGVRLRVGSKSSSISVGGNGGRVTLNSKGRRTTTARLAPGISYTTSTSGTTKKRPAPARAGRDAPPLARNEPLGPEIAPRRSIVGGWVAADLRGVVVHRQSEGDLRIPLAQITKAELDGKKLILAATGHDTLDLRLTTFLSSRDLRFVETLAKAARLAPSPD
ncbi:DUF4236 domain-containing protein [Streptomyces mirabilis]|uniref:DUF4236 domain-containing protein n=1 Tax=Streptomyces mirabilis TaxID=68239 RepID=UPI00382D8E3B